MKINIIFLCVVVALSSCKARKVAIRTSDSTVRTTIDTRSHANEVRTDSSKKTTQQVAVYQDTSGYKVVITPLPGKIVNIGKDGSFSGEAANIEITGKKGINSTNTQNTSTNNAIVDTKESDSSSKATQEVEVKKKSKDTVVTPDYSWIWWVGGGLLILACLFYLYKKFF